MARYIRLYPCPDAEKEGNVLGFSAGIADAAHDSKLHRWLEQRGYQVTTESTEQLGAKLYVGWFSVRTQAYIEAAGIPIPPDTVSASHLLVEPPLRDTDLTDLSEVLRDLEAIDDGGLRKHYFIDNRNNPAEAFTGNRSDVIGYWD